VEELFFEAAAGRRQIRRVHQRHGMGLHALPMEQAAQQMLVDPPQPAHAHLLTELGKHPRARKVSPQPGETSPGGLFRQLCHDQVQRMGGGQHCQQMRAPELGGAQVMPSATGKSARPPSGNEVIGNIIGKHFEQGTGTNGRQRGNHA
jgi:hypothetical protein